MAGPSTPLRSLPPRDRKWVETFPCAICGAPAVIVASDAEDGKPIHICADHLPAEARARALFDAHPHGQRIGRRIVVETE